MGGKRRVVFDTNVIVSALLLADSTPQQALLAAGEDVELLLSEDVVAELDEVLSRDTG
jgi:predicted nucleic acid-binding protein